MLATPFKLKKRQTFCVGSRQNGNHFLGDQQHDGIGHRMTKASNQKYQNGLMSKLS